MKHLLYISFLILISVLISCNEKTEVNGSDAKQYFIKANQSSLKVNDAEYKASFSFTSPKDNFKTWVTINLMRDKNTKLGYIVRFYTEEGSGIYDGNKYYYANDKTKELFITGDKIQPEMLITQNWISQAISMVMLSEDFSDEINARKDELHFIGDSKSGEFDTYVVESLSDLDENKVRTKIRTYFDKASNLPVKEVKSQSRGKESIVQTIEITNLKLNKGIDKSVFAFNDKTDYKVNTINPETEPAAANINTIAQDFTLTDYNGREITLSKLRGNVVILDFWGTWCHWCVKAMPKLQKVHEHFRGKNVIVLGISCRESDEADPKKFMADKNITYNSLLYGDEVAAKYGVKGFPTLYVIGKDGKILENKSGFSESMDKELIELIEKNM